MRYLEYSLLFLALLLLHVALITIFSLNFYILYFIFFLVSVYILSYKFKEYPLKLFMLHVALIFILINLNVYDEVFFEVSLHFNFIGKLYYIDSEIMYALSAIHILVFINLKRFENIWAIIGKNYLG